MLVKRVPVVQSSNQIGPVSHFAREKIKKFLSKKIRIFHLIANVNGVISSLCWKVTLHDDAIKWKHFLYHWPFVREIHRSPVNSPHKGQWRGAFMFSLTCAWTNGWVNNRNTRDLRRHRSHYDVSIIISNNFVFHKLIWNILYKSLTFLLEK